MTGSGDSYRGCDWGIRTGSGVGMEGMMGH